MALSDVRDLVRQHSGYLRFVRGRMKDAAMEPDGETAAVPVAEPAAPDAEANAEAAARYFSEALSIDPELQTARDGLAQARSALASQAR